MFHESISIPKIKNLNKVHESLLLISISSIIRMWESTCIKINFRNSIN